MSSTHERISMEKDTTVEYEAPRIEDHGDLAELTAGNSTGEFTDKAFPVHTPKQDITFSGP
jgi:hypothetical protein